MTTHKWPLQSQAAAFYGNPATAAGNESAAWVRDNIVYVKPDFTLFYDGKPMSKGVRVHRKCADSLRRVYAEIWNAYGRSQAALDATGLTKCGGGYTFRQKRGGSSLSMHAYGAAVDHDPARNGMGDATPEFLKHPKILAAFAREGWEWGGDWSGRSRDGMHWQAAWTRAKPARVTQPQPVPAPARSTPSAAISGNGSAPGEPAWTKEQMEEIQKRLKALGYDPGGIDGKFVTVTGRAVAAFLLVNDRTEPVGVISRATRDYLLSDQAKPMAVSMERATATPAEIAAKVPEASATRWAFLTNAGEKAVYAGGLAVGYFSETTSKITDSLPEPIRDAVRDVPSSVLWTGVAVVAVASLFMALRAGRTVETAFKRGRL